MSLGTCHHGMYIARCMVPCLMDHDTLGQTRCALEVLGKLVRLSLSETLTFLALTLMEIDMVKGQKLCFSTQLSHEIPWCHDVFRMKSFCIISFHVVALRNASYPMIRLPFRSFGRCFNETVQVLWMPRNSWHKSYNRKHHDSHKMTWPLSKPA